MVSQSFLTCEVYSQVLNEKHAVTSCHTINNNTNPVKIKCIFTHDIFVFYFLTIVLLIEMLYM